MSLKHSKDRTAWQKHCSEARNEPMRVFGELAARRHLTMRTVAKRAKADVSAFGRYFQSTQPTVTVLTKVAKALDIANPGRVARAFLRTLRVDELTDECYRIAERVSEAETLFGERSADAASAFWGWVNADAEARLDVCIASILADPFDLCESSPRKSVLGGYLGAVEDALGSHGFSFSPFVEDPKTVVANRLEAHCWFDLLCRAANLSDREARRIAQIAFGFDYSLSTGRLKDGVITVTSSESERGRETLEPGPETVAPILLRFVAGLDAKEAYHTRLKHGFALKTTAKVDEIAKTIQRTLDKWTTGRAKRLAEALSEQLKAIERSEVA